MAKNLLVTVHETVHIGGNQDYCRESRVLYALDGIEQFLLSINTKINKCIESTVKTFVNMKSPSTETREYTYNNGTQVSSWTTSPSNY